MGFRYPLQKIVDLKANERTQAEWHLSEAVRQLSEREEELCRLVEERGRWGDELHRASEKSVPAVELQLMQQHLQYLDRRIEIKMREAEQARGRVNNRKRKLKNKMVDEKVWVSAKEKAFVRYMSDMQKKEQSELDDMTSTRFVRM